jgi:hypothetical protein
MIHDRAADSPEQVALHSRSLLVEELLAKLLKPRSQIDDMLKDNIDYESLVLDTAKNFV